MVRNASQVLGVQHFLLPAQFLETQDLQCWHRGLLGILTSPGQGSPEGSNNIHVTLKLKNSQYFLSIC